jgi:hypothetical protein
MGEPPGLTEAQRRGMVESGEHARKDTMMQVTIEVPDDIAERMRQANGPDVARHILEAYALWAYQTGEIGGGQLRRLLGFETRDEVDQFLADHNATHNYTLADLEQDRETARQLGL